MSDLVERLLAAIAEAEDAAEQYPEDHSDPDGVLRLCQAHREIIEEFQKVDVPHVEVLSNWERGRRVSLLFVIEALAGGYGVQEQP